MGRKPKVLFEIKVSAVEDYLKGLKSVQKISDELSVGKTTVKDWIKIYRSKGESGLLPQIRNTAYSRELKVAAVEDYLAGKGSLLDISMKYGLRSSSQLKSWIMKYIKQGDGRLCKNTQTNNINFGAWHQYFFLFKFTAKELVYKDYMKLKELIRMI